MHELGMTRRLLEVVLDRAAAAGASLITDVHLEIGEASDVSPESIEFYWPQVSRATPAEGAHLHFGVGGEPLGFRVTAIDVPDAGTSRDEA
jgi:hydrogenase nickel incorporation protein HypA/HybF